MMKEDREETRGGEVREREEEHVFAALELHEE
jgi:hypothetical protein